MDNLLKSKYYNKYHKDVEKPGEFMTEVELANFLRYFHHFLKPSVFRSTIHNFCLNCFAFVPLKSLSKQHHLECDQNAVVTCCKFLGYQNGRGTFYDKFLEKFRTFIFEKWGRLLMSKGYIRWESQDGEENEELNKKIFEQFCGKVEDSQSVGNLSLGDFPRRCRLTIRRPWFNFHKECRGYVGSRRRAAKRGLLMNTDIRAKLRSKSSK
jgi:hypothetical protein